MEIKTLILLKRTDESRVYTMDFSQMPELTAGDTLASVSYVHCINARGAGTSTTDLTITSPQLTANGKGAQANIAGGIDGGLYHVKFEVLTGAGHTLSDVGHLQVSDD
jgi:hypothetical protein